MEDLGNLLLLIVMLLCVLPALGLLIVGGIIFYVGRKHYSEWVSTDASKLYATYQASYAQNPNADTSIIVQKIIQQQAFRCGVIGAITGFGGFVTLPLSLPVDLYFSSRIQASMVEFIAQAYGMSAAQLDGRLATYAILAGSDRVTNWSIQYALRLITRVMGKSLSKFVPVIGALISFGVNYFFALSAGRVAVRWYAGRFNQALQQTQSPPPPQLT